MSNSGLLNNIKWYNLFECVEHYKLEFELVLTDSKRIISSEIFELEKQSILIDTSGNFIEYKEIQTLIHPITTVFIQDLKSLNIPYYIEENKIFINGYQ